MNAEYKDPINLELRKRKTEERRAIKLRALERDEKDARKRLEEQISTRWQEHILAFQDQVKKLKSGLSDKHGKKMKELDRKNTVDYAKAKEYVAEREALMKNQFEKEVYNVNRKYQHHRGNPITEQMKALEIREIENRWSKQRSQLRETIRQTERKLKIDAESLMKQRRQDEADLDVCLRKINARYYEQQDQHRTFYIQRHENLFNEKRELLLKEEPLYLSETQSADATFQIVTNADDKISEKGEKRYETGGKNGFSTKGRKDTKSPAESSIFRQKLRKTILMKATSSVQLGVDIHNEGILVIHRMNSNNADKSTERTKTEFMPWSSTSRNFLYDIICGVIPLQADLLEVGSFNNSGLQGGQLKCLITDLRVSDETAIKQRAIAFRQIKELSSKGDLAALKEKIAALEATVIKHTEVEAACKKSTKKAAQDEERAAQKLKVMNTFD